MVGSGVEAGKRLNGECVWARILVGNCSMPHQIIPGVHVIP